MVGFRRNSNSSKLLWLSSLPARMKKDQIKNEGSRVQIRFSRIISLCNLFSNAQHYVNVSVLKNVFTKEKCFYLNDYKFSIKSYVVDVY